MLKVTSAPYFAEPVSTVSPQHEAANIMLRRTIPPFLTKPVKSPAAISTAELKPSSGDVRKAPNAVSAPHTRPPVLP